MLGLPGATVAGVEFTPAGVVDTLRRRAKGLRCPACGRTTGAAYDRSVRRWRHLDLGASRLYLESEIRRLRCPRCERVVTEEVPWARPGARHTKDFEDVVAWLAQRADKTTISRLLRCSWEAVGRDAATLRGFFDELGPERMARLQAVSADMGAGYAKAIAQQVEAGTLAARVCIDPFHVVKLANEAIDACRRWAWNQARRSGQATAAWVKRTRWALVKDPGALSTSQRLVLEELRRSRSVLYRAWQLKEALRDVYRLRDLGAAHQFLDRWLAWACRSRIPSFVKLSKTIRAHRDGILAAVELGLSNSKLEGLNSKIRLINHRGYGHHSAAAVIAMIYLCCGGITVRLPTER